MARGTIKITKETIDALAPQAGRDVFLWDSELRGFGVRRKPSGAAAFIVQYRTPQGQTRRWPSPRSRRSRPKRPAPKLGCSWRTRLRAATRQLSAMRRERR